MTPEQTGTPVEVIVGGREWQMIWRQKEPFTAAMTRVSRVVYKDCITGHWRIIKTDGGGWIDVEAPVVNKKSVQIGWIRARLHEAARRRFHREMS